MPLLTTGAFYQCRYIRCSRCARSRWESRELPDPTGAQLRALREYLIAHPDIKLVFYDYSCVPNRGSATSLAKGKALQAAERVAVDFALLNIHLLFLGCSVLVLADQAFLSRFWPQYELWLSLKCGNSGGLSRATKDRQRATVVCVHEALAEEDAAADLLQGSTAALDLAETTEAELGAVSGVLRAQELEILLRRKWERIRPEEARSLLSKPGISLFNVADRDAALACLDGLSEHIRAAYDKASCLELLARGTKPLDLLQIGFSSRIITACGATIKVDDLINSGATLRKLGFTTVQEAVEAVQNSSSIGWSERALDGEDGEGLGALLDSAADNGTLTSLDVRVGAPGIGGLRVRSNNLIIGEGAETLAAAVLACRSLQSFSGVPVMGLRDDTLDAVILDGKHLGTPEIVVLSSLVPASTALLKLSLGGNLLGSDDLHILAEALKINESIQELDVSKNRICGTWTAEDDSTEIIGAFDPHGLRAFAQALKENATLTTLSLRGNAIGKEGARLLSEGLLVNHSVTSLNLAGNLVEADGARSLAAVLGRNARRDATGLTDLNLAVNNLSSEGAKMLSEVLATDSCLQVLSLANNNIAGDSAQAIASAIMGRRFPLDSFGGIPLDALREDSLTMLDLSQKGISAPEVLVLSEALVHSGGSLETLKLHASVNRTLRKHLEAANSKREREIRFVYADEAKLNPGRFGRKASSKR